MFFFNDTATTEIYTLSLHDALPICGGSGVSLAGTPARGHRPCGLGQVQASVSTRENGADRKSTRLNSSHANTSYAVFCLKQKPLSSPCFPALLTSSLSLPFHLSPLS